MHVFNVMSKVVAAAALVFLVAGGARAANDGLQVAKGKDGSYLTDSKGMALYTFKKDAPGKSVCGGDCVAKWPPFYQEKVGATGDLKAADFATITRDDGQKQTTFKGMPLYYFVGDLAAGDTKGQGVGNVWYLAKP
jgi:predicted lipoprotein with Yx(FWY)xxD motif